jgi:phenylpropionate dioxygenase-like ring-hydroxylating dioxygenase large terminal subunit
MFVHKNQLEYQLQPKHYYDRGHFETERERLFLPTWHFVASRADVPQEGDFITLELLGRPLILWNRAGGIRAFLNVCSHRHCHITSAPQGCSEQLTCQYHGWQYSADGRTKKIPDAGCFRPFDRENARLTSVRAEMCGELIFVCLQDNGVELAEYLGEYHEKLQQFTAPQWKQNWSWSYDFDCNWKVPVENTVETYHVPSVHKGYFAGVYPSEHAQLHTLEHTHSTLCYDLNDDARAASRQRMAMRWISDTLPHDMYTHTLIHPNLVITDSDVYLHAQSYLPLSPTRTRSIARMFSLQGNKRGSAAWLVRKLIGFFGARMDHEVQTEDGAVYAPQQQGIVASPHRGVLGTREERIYAFQKYVRATCIDSDFDGHRFPEGAATVEIRSDRDSQTV